MDMGAIMTTLMQFCVFDTDMDYMHVLLCSDNKAFYVITVLFSGDCQVANAVTRCNSFLHALEVYESNRL